MVERRNDPRTPFTGKAYLTFDGRCRCEDVVDVSRTGLFLRSGARLRAGKPVKVFLPLPGHDGWRMCLLKGRVTRRTGDGMGITLASGETDTRLLLERFLTAA